ncbi:MAG: 50S ribosomal protein L4 [Clostridiales bacterium]|jgi:large subunit ribosomal protein L4|nr:50S ribosomal protein L4 [Clostridiales bacterium]
MVSVKVVSKDGSETGSLELDENIFNIEVKENLVHMAVVQYLANQRQGTQSAKTRAEVRGGGRKPWRQKGTGRARQGSTRSPQWTGGGVVFAPKPRDYSFKLNKKVKRIALKSVLTQKVRDSKLIIVDDLKLNAVKTKEAVTVLKNIDAGKALIVIGDNDTNAYLSFRNIPTVKTAAVNTINVYDILLFDKLVLSKESVMKIQEVYA